MQNQTSGIYPQNMQNAISSSAVHPQANPMNGYKDIYYVMEQAIGADVQNVKNMVAKGILTQQQGHTLLVQLASKAQSINAYRNTQNMSDMPMQNVPISSVQNQSPMALFNLERPGFFDAEGRGDVLNYIKGFDMDKDEIFRISELVEGLENSAVDKYLKKIAYEKSLNDENTLAKSKLTSYAQNASSDNKMNRIFTREDIGNMSGEECTKNEKLIFEQAKRGLIK